MRRIFVVIILVSGFLALVVGISATAAEPSTAAAALPTQDAAARTVPGESSDEPGAVTPGETPRPEDGLDAGLFTPKPVYLCYGWQCSENWQCGKFGECVIETGASCGVCAN